MTLRRSTMLLKLKLRERMKVAILLEHNLRLMGRMKPRMHHAMKAKAELHS
jgi:hypothetical protein